MENLNNKIKEIKKNLRNALECLESINFTEVKEGEIAEIFYHIPDELKSVILKAHGFKDLAELYKLKEQNDELKKSLERAESEIMRLTIRLFSQDDFR